MDTGRPYKIRNIVMVKLSLVGNGNSWDGSAAARTPSRKRNPQNPRQRSTSQRAKGKGKNNKGGKGKGVKGSETVTAPSPFAPYPTTPTLAPWPAADSSAALVPSPLPAQAPMNNELVAALKRAYPDGLPQEVQDLVERSSDTASRQLTKDLHSATTALGKARRSLRDAQAAETSHRQAWLKHLKEATKQWGEQLDQYRRRQTAFQEAKMRASQEVEAARKLIQSLNSQTVPKEVVSTAVEEVDEAKTNDAEVQEEEELKKILQVTLTACAEATGLQFKKVPPDEILINSDDENQGGSKRQRQDGVTGPPPSS